MPAPPHHPTAIGNVYEAQAYAYLCQQGLHPLAQQYRTPRGEIDIIMQDPHTHMVIFVEVRFRRSTQWIHPLETITIAKKKRIQRTALHYLQQKGWGERYPCRFDMVAFYLRNQKTCLEWYPHVFEWA